MSTAVIPINQEDLEVRALGAVDEAKTLKVTDQRSYARACVLLRDAINPLIAEVEETFNPICDAAYKTWKTATDKRKQHKDPLVEAKQAISDEIGAFELAQRQQAEAAERAIKEAQELAIAVSTEAAIEAAEASGATVEEIRAIVEQPMILPRPVSVPTLQKVDGVSTRKLLRVEVTDIRALCRAIADGKCSTNLVIPNESALNAMARAQGAEMLRFTPGIRILQTSSVAARKK